MSGAPLDMTLDDLIKSNKKSGSRGRGRGSSSGSGPGPNRRFSNRSANRAAPYAVAKAPESTWGHDMFSAAAGRGSNIETGTKLYISNLDYSVSIEDIKELFSEVGDMKRYTVHYDRSGRSKGTAEVVFSRRQDALDAVKRYNNVQLDGKPMKIELVGTNLATAAAILPPTGAFGDANVVPRREQRRGGGFGNSRGGGRGRGFGRGRGQGRGRGEKVSAEDLDADLEKYHADAMETN
ncbi:THO complex subunit 4A-like [Olea europaea subsp. europaea]|uniref:THO complex subunit 4A-like n=1 Tax=Olea europaea subsp. europaea TaxID=158383 RepID=A0A8S0QT75_OLEEU|nr:THO complex subunit 4A-like [Olea europaea subsp. europaea]